MSDELLIPASPPPEEPFSQRWGLIPHYQLRLPVGTSITESGVGHDFGLELHIAENFNERYTLAVEFPFATTELKLLPTTGSEGTTASHSHWAAQFGMGRFTRSYPYFGDNGDFKFALNVGVTPLIGGGKSTISASDRTLEDETFSFGGKSASTWDLGTAYTFTGEWRPAGGRGPVFNLGPGAYYGLQYDKADSAFNRVRLDFMLMFSVGYGDGSTRAGADADTEVGAMAITQGLFAMGHGFAQRLLFDKTISQPMEALGDYGLIGNETGNTRGSMADVPFLQAGAAFAGGLSSPMTVPLRAGTGWFYGFAGLRAVGGGVSLGVGSKEGQAGGVSELLGVGRMVSYGIAGIEEPSKRISKAPEEVEHREMYINLASYALNTAVMLIGAAASNDAMLKGGSGANVSVAMSPDPLERGMAERTEVGYVPYSFYWSDKRSGHRAGIIVHKSWHDFPTPSLQLFSTATFLSPMLTLGNATNAAAPDGPYQDVALNTDIGAALGLEWKTTWTRLSLGVDTRGVYGGGDAAKAGIGGMAGFDLIFPFSGSEDGSGIGLGVRASAHKLLPKGSQYEIAPWAGASFSF